MQVSLVSLVPETVLVPGCLLPLLCSHSCAVVEQKRELVPSSSGHSFIL